MIYIAGNVLGRFCISASNSSIDNQMWLWVIYKLMRTNSLIGGDWNIVKWDSDRNEGIFQKNKLKMPVCRFFVSNQMKSRSIGA
jgi:hypothetical protein